MKQSEIDELLDLSAWLGQDPLLVQAGTGNTSIKDDATMWIKASGKRLARARVEPILMPINLKMVRRCVRNKIDVSTAFQRSWQDRLKPSVETALHAVMPHRVVVHVHSVNAIAWAVRSDGPAVIAPRLAGLDWRWIPYVSSGLPLAHAIEERLARFPQASVFVLGNHGLVVGAENCRDAELLLEDVERRLAVVPRTPYEYQDGRAPLIRENADWRLPEDPKMHLLGADPVSRQIVLNGILYPCHAMFLGHGAPPIYPAHEVTQPRRAGNSTSRVYAIVEDSGVMIRRAATPVELEMLSCLVNVVQRIPAGAPIRYLTGAELRDVDENMSSYCGSVHENETPSAENRKNKPALTEWRHAAATYATAVQQPH